MEVVVAQRLVRVICTKCKEELPASELEIARAEFGPLVPEKLYRGAGCRNCQNTGYRGRQGIFEVMAVSDEIRALILNRAPSHEIRKVAVRQGMRSLREDGWRIVGEGRTTIDEVIANTKDEEAVAAGFNSGAAAVHAARGLADQMASTNEPASARKAASGETKEAR